MSARSRRLMWAAVLALMVACGGPNEAASGASDGASDPTASEPTAADPAVVVALAVRANPAATDSILAAHGLTRDAFNALMYQVAADAERARAYAEAMR